MDPVVEFLRDEVALDYVFNLRPKDAGFEFEIPASDDRKVVAKLLSHDVDCNETTDEDEEPGYEWTYGWSLEIGGRTYRITATETTGAEDGPQSFDPDEVSVVLEPPRGDVGDLTPSG